MKITRDGVDRSTNYLPDELSSIAVRLSAFDGEVGLGSIPIPDDDGDQEPYEGERLLLEQGSVTIVDGFVGGTQFLRGQGVSVGPRQTITYALGDDNALLHGHATAGWARPAEAPHARWAAFVDDFLPAGIDTTWLLTTNESGVTLPKKTYRTDSLFDELLADTSDKVAKTAYIENRRFHWHLITEGQICELALSDTGTETSTLLRIRNPERIKDALDLRNEITGRNDKGQTVTVSDATSIGRHNSAGLKHQGYEQYSSESTSVMTSDLNAKLAERKNERITYKAEIGPLTAAQVEKLIPGSLINCTSAVWRLSSSTQRIAAVTLGYRVSPDGRHFTATVELGYPIRIRRKPPRTAPQSPFDPAACADSLLVPWNAGGTEGFCTIPDSGVGAGAFCGSANTIRLYAGCTYRVEYTVHFPGTDWYLTAGLPAGGTANLIVGGTNNDEGLPPHIFSTLEFTVGGGAGTFADVHTSLVHQPRGGFTGAFGEVFTRVFYVDGPDPRFDGVATDCGPAAGQQVINDVASQNADGSTTTFNTFGNGSFRPGSLHVLVNGVDWTGEITSYDADAGTVTLAHAPKFGSKVVLEWVAA